MFGLLFSLAVATACALSGCAALRRVEGLDPAERLGVGGLAGLGALGWLAFPAGLAFGARSGTAWVLAGGALIAGALCVRTVRSLEWKGSDSVGTGVTIYTPRRSIYFDAVVVVRFVGVVALALLALVPLVGALAPPDSIEWDSLAYHLAVPKLWLQTGRMAPVEFIHQSAFPFAVDNLFWIGLGTLGEVAAKGFSFAIYLLGVLAVFGVARRLAPGNHGAPWTAAGIFAGCPLVLWLSGTAYVDVAHGLYAGLGVLYGAEALAGRERGRAAVAAALLGLACASKYTGLQAVAAFALVGLAAAAWRRDGAAMGRVALAVVGALAIAAPWMVRNEVVLGNPVFPFFSSVLGGKNWDEFQAAIYRDEQQTFGVGRTQTGRDPLALGHAILGLAYQPGRYINPGQTQGLGFPMGAVGAAAMVAGLAGLLFGRSPALRVATGVAGLQLALWFFLSQQSRYLAAILPIFAVAGAAATRHRWLTWLAAAQAAFSVWLVGTLVTSSQLPVAIGAVGREAFLRQRVGFAGAAAVIDREVRPKKVALYDEVFGYLLDSPYEWANPGHPTSIPYAKIASGAALVDALRVGGFSHVYLNLVYQDRDFRGRWLAAMGLSGGIQPLAEEERRSLLADRRTAWKVHVAQAVAEGLLVPERTFRSSVLFRVGD